MKRGECWEGGGDSAKLKAATILPLWTISFVINETGYLRDETIPFDPGISEGRSGVGVSD